MSSAHEPLVSILVPAFNSGRWIADTLRSALAQTWQRKEIIVVDDGSTDDTLAIAQGFAAAGVRVVSQPNQGAAAARNHAFVLSRGEYIQWLDADDLLAPDKIARQMAARVSDRVLLSAEWGRFLVCPERAEFRPSALWKDASPVDWLTAKLAGNLHMQTGTWLVSRRLTEEAGPWDTRLTADDDGEYFCRVLRASDGVRFVPGAKVFYRLSGTGSLSYVEDSPRKIEQQWLSMQEHMKVLLALEDSPRTRAACVAYLTTWYGYFYPEHQQIAFEARALAEKLGGVLARPRLSWKYHWLTSLFGWSTAKKAQARARKLRWSAQRTYERLVTARAR